MNIPKGETRQELLNKAFLYLVVISLSVIIFLKVRTLVFDLFVAVVLAVLAEQWYTDYQKKLIEKQAL